jgi:hypothetical protein
VGSGRCEERRHDGVAGERPPERFVDDDQADEKHDLAE